MTKLAILPSGEQRAFDAPPKFQKIDRPRYFSMSPEIRQLGSSKLRAPINRVGFVLQPGSFRAPGKFFVAEKFHKRDIQYVILSKLSPLGDPSAEARQMAEILRNTTYTNRNKHLPHFKVLYIGDKEFEMSLASAIEPLSIY